MNRELIINVTPTEISIALAEDKVLVELNKEQCQTGFSVGDIYLGKVRKIMPGLNAAFVNIGHEKDAFIHYLDLGSQFSSLKKLVAAQQPGKRGVRLEGIKLEPALEKSSVLVMRDTTERPEGVEAGTLKLAGTKMDDIYRECRRLLTEPETYRKMSEARNPYGDGTASIKIRKILEYIDA